MIVHFWILKKVILNFTFAYIYIYVTPFKIAGNERLNAGFSPSFSETFPTWLVRRVGAPRAEILEWLDVRRTLTQAVAIRSAFRCAWRFLVAPVVWRDPCTCACVSVHAYTRPMYILTQWRILVSLNIFSNACAKMMSIYNVKEKSWWYFSPWICYFINM